MFNECIKHNGTIKDRIYIGHNILQTLYCSKEAYSTGGLRTKNTA